MGLRATHLSGTQAAGGLHCVTAVLHRAQGLSVPTTKEDSFVEVITPQCECTWR